MEQAELTFFQSSVNGSGAGLTGFGIIHFSILSGGIRCVRGVRSPLVFRPGVEVDSGHTLPFYPQRPTGAGRNNIHHNWDNYYLPELV